MAKREVLVEAYIGALDIRALVILAVDGRQPTKISFKPDKSLVEIDSLWFSKPQHAELVLSHCWGDLAAIGATRSEGWIDMPAREVRDTLANVAGYLGASFRTFEQVRRDAETAVTVIEHNVEKSRREGGLAKVNAEYKAYRIAQQAKGLKAAPYSAHLADFTRSLVILAAKNANAGRIQSPI